MATQPAVEDAPTLGDAIRSIHANGDALGPEGVSLFASIVDAMNADRDRIDAILRDYAEDDRDTLDLVRRRIRTILNTAPRLGTTRDYEQALALIEMSLLVNRRDLDAFRENGDIGVPLPGAWRAGLEY